jgi:hypothetical protein
MLVGIVIPGRGVLEHKTYFLYQNSRNKSLNVRSTDILYYEIG